MLSTKKHMFILIQALQVTRACRDLPFCAHVCDGVFSTWLLVLAGESPLISGEPPPTAGRSGRRRACAAVGLITGIAFRGRESFGAAVVHLCPVRGGFPGLCHLETPGPSGADSSPQTHRRETGGPGVDRVSVCIYTQGLVSVQGFRDINIAT